MANGIPIRSQGRKDGICEDTATGTYGYRLPETTECKPYGPFIRLQAGVEYYLFLVNKSPKVEANMHPHGLHVLGDGWGDDVTRLAAPNGGCVEYRWKIPVDHVPGTFWYHSHVKGKTEEHVAGGAFGMIVVDDDPQDFSDVNVFAWAYDHQYEHILQIVRIGGSTVMGNGGNAIANQAYDTMTLKSGKYHRVRVGIFDKQARTDLLEFAGCSHVYQVASDGVWLSQHVPVLPGGGGVTTHGGSRTDFAVCCDAGESLTIDFAGSTAAVFETGTSSSFSCGSFVPYDFQRPEGMRFTDSSPIDGTFSISMSGAKINGKAWDPVNPITGAPEIRIGQVHEWTLSGTQAHPFHIHLKHMLVVEPGGCGNAHAFGEFYDSIPASCSCRVRFSPKDFGGRCVFHCHVLNREDRGAMSWINITKSDGSGVWFIDPPQTCQNQMTGFEEMCPNVHLYEPPSPTTSATTVVAATTVAATTPTATTTTTVGAATFVCIGSNQECDLYSTCCSGLSCQRVGNRDKCRPINRRVQLRGGE